MAAEFIGEHLLPGKLGYLFIIVSFVAALFSTFTYFKAASTEKTDLSGSNSWLRLARGGFILHTLAIICIFSTLYYVITNHLFEYHYAWSHSSYDLPGKYLLSCFWEGQEGSFMLWMFWHSVIGLVVMRTAGKLESRTMAIIAMVQVILGTMLLGLYFGDSIQIGSNPFKLLRHAMQDAPIFSSPNYMNFIKDGNGLNISLQNYWMVIHPPVLFLGFALSLVPFAYCVAALWTGDYKSFIKPTIAWSLLGGAVLGTGIMMGGAWAYESLNFGGYWAWDPVENASLVPWLVLIAGLHTLLIYKSTGRALSATIIFLLLSHLLIWYSTFLTRTGILGKTSVHAFTGDGEALYYHLLIVLGWLALIGVGLLLLRWKQLPRIKTEETTLSREFWMFIGSAVLCISAVMIITITSLPVWAPLAKKITGKDFAPPLNPVATYNSTQVWIAIIIGLLAGLTLFMKYKQTDAATLWKRIAIVAGISVVMTVLIGWGQKITTPQYVVMLFTSCFAVVASIAYGLQVQKLKFRNLGPSVSHFGFGAVLLGILLSSYNKHAISINTTGEVLNFGKATAEEEAKESRENELLPFGRAVAMGEYFATYIGDSSVPGKDRRVYYKVRFDRMDATAKKVEEQFMLYPDAFINPKGNESGLSANPSTKHYWNRDIFTYISMATDKTKADTSSYHEHQVKNPGDTIYLKAGYMVFNGFRKNAQDARYPAGPDDITIAADITAYDVYGGSHKMAPLFVLQNRGESLYRLEDTVKLMDLYVRFDNFNVKSPEDISASIQTKQTDPMDDFIVLKALVFPYINVLWLGVIIMVFGFFISIGKLITTGGKTRTGVLKAE